MKGEFGVFVRMRGGIRWTFWKDFVWLASPASLSKNSSIAVERKIDAVVEDEIAFSGYIDSGKYRFVLGGQQLYLTFAHLTVLSSELIRAALGRPTQQRWAVPFPKSRPEAAQVREAMNKAMAELASKGTLAEIWNKWFGQGQFAEYFGVKAVPVCLTSEWSE